MEIPENVKTYELTSSTVWFDEDGVLYSVPKPGKPPELTMDETKAEMDKFRKIIGPGKVCLISEANPNSRAPKKEERDFIAETLNSFIKAFAIVTTSPVAKMITNLFFGLKPPPYPTKTFSNEKDAKEWIKQYL